MGTEPSILRDNISTDIEIGKSEWSDFCWNIVYISWKRKERFKNWGIDLRES